MTKHTEAQIQEALALVPMPDRKTAQAWERQLRADNPGAWFIVHNRKARKVTR